MGISSSSLAKLTKDKNVTTEVLSKICQKLKCDVADILDPIQPLLRKHRTGQAREIKCSLPNNEE